MKFEIQTYTTNDLLGDLNEVESKHAPERLYLAGDKSVFYRGPRVSMVGSRNATREGLTRADIAARELASAGIIVVSGLAEGIDTAAHRAAMDSGGHTIAVVGTPLTQVFPKSNEELFLEIVAHHAAVSQFDAGKKPGRHSFPMRNRTMALLTEATIVVEAGEKSGTLHQGWEAIRLGRPLFLMESLLDSGLSWPSKMIDYGAEVLTRDNMALVIDYLVPRSFDVAL